MAFVFPGSAPPMDIPDSIVEEVQNPLMDSTNQASFSRRRAEQLTARKIGSAETTNLFAPVHSSASLHAAHHERSTENDCWLEYDCSKTTLDEEAVHEELSKLKGCAAIRRKSNTIWLVQFTSQVFAEKYAVYDCFQWATMTQESLMTHPTNAIEAAEASSAPNIWLHPPKYPAVEEEDETAGRKLAFWKVLLLWLVGMEEHPARFLTSTQ